MTRSEPVHRSGSRRRGRPLAAFAVATTLVLLGGSQLAAAAPPSPASASPASVSPTSSAVGTARADHHPAGYSLVFHDEFDGRELDRSIWCTRYQYDGGPDLQVPDAGCLGRDPSTGATLGTLDTLGGDGTSQGQESEVYRDFNVDGRKMHTCSTATSPCTRRRPCSTSRT